MGGLKCRREFGFLPGYAIVKAYQTKREFTCIAGAVIDLLGGQAYEAKRVCCAGCDLYGSMVCNIGLLIRLHEVRNKRVYREILAVSLSGVQQQAEEYRSLSSGMACRYLLGDLCVIRDMTARLEAPDSDGVREFYHLAVANPSFL